MNYTILALACLAISLTCARADAEKVVEEAKAEESIVALEIRITDKKVAVKMLAQIAASYPQLERLHIDYSPYGSVADQFIAEIVKIKKLSELKLSGDIILTESQLSRLAKKPTLKKLSFACP